MFLQPCMHLHFYCTDLSFSLGRCTWISGCLVNNKIQWLLSDSNSVINILKIIAHKIIGTISPCIMYVSAVCVKHYQKERAEVELVLYLLLGDMLTNISCQYIYFLTWFLRMLFFIYQQNAHILSKIYVFFKSINILSI